MGEAALMLGGLPETRASRVSLLHSVRLLERRGLVTIERAPDPRGGWPRMLAAARPGAAGELTAPELQRARLVATSESSKQRTAPTDRTRR